MSEAKGLLALLLLLVLAVCCQCQHGSTTEDISSSYYDGYSPIGEYCYYDSDCIGYNNGSVQCSSDRCRCRPEFIPITPCDNPSTCNTFCKLLRNEIGQPCEYKEQCTTGVPGALSDCLPSLDDPSKRICNCSDGNINQPGYHKCWPIRHYVRDECEVDIQCSYNLGNYSVCHSRLNYCTCYSGGVPSTPGDKCLLKQDEMGGPCIDNNQCTLGSLGNMSACRLNDDIPPSPVCLCSDEAVTEIGENICRRRAVSVGDHCVRSAQCKANLGYLSECLMTSESCICTPFYGVPNFLNDKCLPVINFIGGECEERQQCTSGTPGQYSDCLDSPVIPGEKVCNCTEGAEHLPGRHECLTPFVYIGQPCERDDQCAGEPGVSSVCSMTSGVCKCLGGYVPSGSNNDCLPIRNQLEDACSVDVQCQKGVPGPVSACQDDVCKCTRYSVNEPDQHVCHRRATLVGDSCQVNVQCQANLGEHSHCVGELCECKSNAVPSADKTRCVVNLV